jgi:predicted DNA-binding ribbon-helix-helix protein
MDSPAAAVKKRSVVLAGHRTSISLEAEFWQALREVAEGRLLSVNALVASVDAARGPAPPANLSSALRVFVLDCYRRGELPRRANTSEAER